jgi:cyclopropane fatty-acyl-phospholipid synthase-like methyltransferase
MQSLRVQAKDFWKERSDPLWCRPGEDWPRRHALEYLALLPQGGTLLDVGCGAGELFAYLAPYYKRIIGIDSSQSMLAAAHENTKKFALNNVTLHSADACHFPEAITKVDAVLVSGVVQYLDRSALLLHLSECRRVLAEDGVVVVGAIPKTARRWFWYCGVLGDQLPSLTQTGKNLLRAWRRQQRARKQNDFLWDGIGRWYSVAEIDEIASASGFEADFRNAWYFDYRFHAILRRKSLAG